MPKQAPAPAPVQEPPQLTGRDVVLGIQRALTARDTAADDAGRDQANRAIMQGVGLLERAMWSAGDAPDAFNLRAGATEVIQALDFEAWSEQAELRMKRLALDYEREHKAVGAPLDSPHLDLGQRAALSRLGEVGKQRQKLSEEYDLRSQNLELFRSRGSFETGRGSLRDGVTTTRTTAGSLAETALGNSGKFYIRPELANWLVKLNDPDSLHRQTISTGPLRTLADGNRVVDTERGEVPIPVLDDVAKASIRESLHGINPWSPHQLSAFFEGMGTLKELAYKGHDAVRSENKVYEGRIRNVTSANPALKLPFLPNLSGSGVSRAELAARGIPINDKGGASSIALSLARLRDPAWARAVAEEVDAAIEANEAPAISDVALGAGGMVLDFVATMGAAKVAGKALGGALAAAAPQSKLALQTGQAFADVASASSKGGGFLPTGLTGTAQMVGYEGIKAAVTGEDMGDAVTRGVLLGAASSVAHLIARPVTRTIAAALSRTPLPFSRAFADALYGLPDAAALRARMISRPSQDVTIRELVGSTTRNARWAQQIMHWCDSFMVGAQFGAWEAARREIGPAWDQMGLDDKALEAAKRIGSNEAIGMGMGFGAAGMLYAGATHNRFNASWARMNEQERAAVDRMVDYLHNRMTGPQGDLQGWVETVRWFDEYRAMHPEEFKESERPTAPQPGGNARDLTLLGQAEGFKQTRYAENAAKRESFFREAGPDDFDAGGEPKSARAKAYWERYPVEQRGAARRQEIVSRFQASQAAAEITPDGPRYTFQNDTTGDPEFYAMPRGPYAVRRLQQSGAGGGGWRSTGWAVVYGEGSAPEKFGERVANTSAYERPGDAMAVALAMAIRQGLAKRYVTPRSDRREEPPQAGEASLNFPKGPPKPGDLPGPIDPNVTSSLTPEGAPAGSGQRQMGVQPGDAGRPASPVDPNVTSSMVPYDPTVARGQLRMGVEPGDTGRTASPVAPATDAELAARARASAGQLPLSGTAQPGDLAGPVDPRVPGELGQRIAVKVGQQTWWVTPEEAQRAVDAHHADPDKAGLPPLEVLRKLLEDEGIAALAAEAVALHQARMAPPEPVGTKGGTTARVAEGETGKAPLPKPEQVPSARVAAGVEAPERVQVADIRSDPARFQFKANTSGSAGVNEQDIASGKYDPRKAGIVLVWEQADGQLYVVDGHHRVERARRAGQPDILAWKVREANGVTAEMARAEGAVLNIANGKGTAVDAAKLIRDAGWTAKQLEDLGINTKAGLGRQAVGVAKLSDPVFSAVVNGEIPENFAAIIGRELAGQDGKQLEALRAAKRLNSEAEVSAAVRDIKTAEEFTETTGDLFGEQTQTRSLVVERAQVTAAVSRRLKEEKAAFNHIAKNAGLAETIEGNVIDRAATGAAAKVREDLIDTFEKLASVKGPVSDALNEAARKLAAGEPIAAAADAALKRLGEVDWRGGAQAQQPGRAQVAPGAQPAQSVRTAELKKPIDVARERVNQANASAEAVLNILRDAGVVDTTSAKGIAEFGRVLDSLVRGDDAVLVAMQLSGAYPTSEAAAAAYNAARQSALNARSYSQQAAFELAKGNKGETEMLEAYFKAMEDHAHLRTLTPETVAALKRAQLMSPDGTLNKEATQLLTQWVELRAAKQSGNKGRSGQAGFIFNPALAFSAVLKGLWSLFSTIDRPENESQWAKFTRLQGTIERLSPLSDVSMSTKAEANQPVLPRSLLRLAQLYNKSLGGMWTNTFLPERVRLLQRDFINETVRPRDAELANTMFQLEDLFARHLTINGRRVDTMDLRILYDAVDSGAFRAIKSEAEWAKRFGDQRRYLYPFAIELTRLSNAILDRGVELGRFDPRQADKMRSAWIPHEYVRAQRDMNAGSLLQGSLAPIIDRHSISRSGSSPDQAALQIMDPYYLWQSALRREARTNNLLQILDDMRTKGIAQSHSYLEQTVGPGLPTYNRAFYETAALGDQTRGIRAVDPVHGRSVEGRQIRFAMVLRQVLDSMQSKENYEKGVPAQPGQRGFNQDLYDLVEFYLGPDQGRPNREGLVRPGAYIPEGVGRELDYMIDELLPKDSSIEVDWVSRALGFNFTPAAAFGAAIRAWRQNVTVHSYSHWTGNQVSNVFMNWTAGRVPISDYVSSILFGRGHFATAMQDALAFQAYVMAGKPEVRPSNMTPEQWEAALRFNATADQLQSGLFVNTIAKQGGIAMLLGPGIEPDAITETLRTDLARKQGLTGYERAELEGAIADFGRRMAAGQGAYERLAMEMLGTRNASAKIAATNALHGQYGIWELVHKHAGALAQLEANPNMSPRDAAVFAAQGTVDYGDTSPLIRNAYNDPAFRRSQAYYQTESGARAKQLGRYLLANPFALFFAGGAPRWASQMWAHPARSAAAMAAASGIAASLWAIHAALAGEDEQKRKLLAMPGSRGFEGLPQFRPEEAKMAADGMGYQPVLWETDIPQTGLRDVLQYTLTHAAGTAPAPGGMVSDVGKLNPQLDMLASALHTVRDARARSSADNVTAAADSILGLVLGLQTALVSGAVDFLASDQPAGDRAMQDLALKAMRRTMPQTGDFWWASRGGQDAIGAAMGADLPELLRAMPVPNRDAGERAAQAAWRFFWNARALRPYSGWKDNRDLGQAIADVVGLKPGTPVASARPERLKAARALAAWAPRQVSVTYSDFLHGRYAEPATFDSMLAWRFGLAHDLRRDVPGLALVDEPQTDIGKWIKAQQITDPSLGSELLELTFDYVHGPAFQRAVAPIMDVARTRFLDPVLVEEAFHSSARDPSGAGLLKMTLALAKRDPDKQSQAWAIYRNLPVPDRGTQAEGAYKELQAMFRERDRGVMTIPALPHLFEVFGAQSLQGGLPAVRTVIDQERRR